MGERGKERKRAREKERKREREKERKEEDTGHVRATERQDKRKHEAEKLIISVSSHSLISSSQHTVYDEVMPLLISDPVEKGGLGFNTTRIGAIGKEREPRARERERERERERAERRKKTQKRTSCREGSEKKRERHR
jgi:hypothetical protein